MLEVKKVVQLRWTTERGAPETDGGARTLALDAARTVTSGPDLALAPDMGL